jgi:hypothetical protein
MKQIGLIIDGDQYTAIFNDTLETFPFSKDHSSFHELMECVTDSDRDGFLELYNITNSIQESLDVGDYGLSIRNGAVYLNGEEVNGEICDKIVQFYKEGLDYKFLVNFLVRLKRNPSKTSVDQLFKFLQNKHLAIAPDGRFWAYKSVRSSYKDKYSNSIDNSVGSVCEVDRNKVDDNSSNHCSHGLHVGALEYAGPGGWYNSLNDRVMIVAVDPADAVSVPTDHSFQKLRVCKYEVVGEYMAPLATVEREVSSARSTYELSVDDLSVGDQIEISVYGEDYEGQVSVLEEDYLELIGRDADGVYDAFEFDLDDIDSVRYL